jgi:hypothetical protein
MLHPYIVHPSREGPFGPQHLGERQAEMLRDRQVCNACQCVMS